MIPEGSFSMFRKYYRGQDPVGHPLETRILTALTVLLRTELLLQLVATLELSEQLASLRPETLLKWVSPKRVMWLLDLKVSAFTNENAPQTQKTTKTATNFFTVLLLLTLKNGKCLAT